MAPAQSSLLFLLLDKIERSFEQFCASSIKGIFSYQEFNGTYCMTVLVLYFLIFFVHVLSSLYFLIALILMD